MKKKNASQDAWYTSEGPDSDVVISSRVRVARNLAGFKFPPALRSEDAERVQSLVLDAYNRLSMDERFQMVRISDMDAFGRKIMSERGVIEPDCGSEPWRSVAIRNDGVVSMTVNMEDHVRIAAFGPGQSLGASAGLVKALEHDLAGYLSFCSMKGFGFLSSSIMDSGNALRASVLLRLSALCMNGMIERVIRDYLAQGFVIRGYYGQRNGLSLGCVYQLSNLHSNAADADTVIAAMDQAVSRIVALERKSRDELLASRPTTLEDSFFRAIVTAKYARFLSFAEAVDLVQRIRNGVHSGLVTGVAYKDLTALLYRVQNAHIGFIIAGGNVIIEDDVASEEMKLDRLRAMIVQEVLKTADIRERRQ